MPHEDSITLGGQTLLTRDTVRAEPVSEFQAGIKIGKATYDDREHAFFLVLDDFSGGMGSRILDVRETQGAFWDVLDTNPPDTRRAGHLTIGTRVTQTDLGTAINSVIGANPSMLLCDYPWYFFSSDIFFGMGSLIYQYTSQLSGPTLKNNAGYAAGGLASLVLGRANTAAGSRLPLAAFISSSSRYLKASDQGATWVNGAANKTLLSAFAWDNKILAFNLSPSGLIFATKDAGAEAWNIDDVNDAEIIVSSDGMGVLNSARFAGVAQSPWGEPAVYFYSPTTLYVLDFFARKYYPINIAGLSSITYACLWNGELLITDGINVIAYNPVGGTVRQLGLPHGFGLPPSLVTSAIVSLLPGKDQFYAAVYDSAANTVDLAPGASNIGKTKLMCYNGVGWHQMGPSVSGFYPTGMFEKGFTYNQSENAATATREIAIIGVFTHGAATATGGLLRYSVPPYSDAPVVDTDIFGTSGSQLVTGWLNGGFNDLDGALLRLKIDAFHLTATETVTVEYRLDDNESGNWTQMVDANNAVDVFDNATSTLYFSQASPKQGVQFRTVQFRITLNRGGTSTKSPEVKAFTLVFTKKPAYRAQWTLNVDVNRMIEAGTLVDSAAATMANVYAKLKSLWNTQTLLALVVPNVEPAPGVNVQINSLALTFDDFRNAVKGQGVVSLTALEPTAA